MFWYEDEVKQLEIKSKQVADITKTIFYGSSTIRLWSSLLTDLPQLQAVNLGFGGSTLAACVWFFNRVMQGYKPERLIVYAGDNDLGDGRNPEELFIFFQQLTVVVKERFGDIPCYFISLKPSPSRWNIADKFVYANSLIKAEIVTRLPNWKFINLYTTMLNPDGKPKKELFMDDGLHLSKKGYELWANVITESVNSNF
ncbi:GDSL family lipase [Mucilaginibacter limnophilus]|uniref:GDSL family lipase n=1 Tax=Mucilaginibacter limnophilus TaxID=1932778 RepID=A0A3S2UMG6_9SPHI|nr:GDSL-type esterase/lipase family protein [Mucilaginibacter limnophilus]RVT98370.1 GDSL family lipase [Mucilaginibacter limnophilus]